MKEISLNLLDIAQNSVSAGATLIELTVRESQAEDIVLMSVADNGKGMSPEFLARVTDPFTTTRTTRPVGMGLPLLKMEAEMTGGGLEIKSELGRGTTVTATFRRSHIDTPPLGDLKGTVVTLIQGSPDINFVYRRETDHGQFVLSTEEMREELGGIPLDEPEVLAWIGEYIEENEQSLQGE